MDASFEERVDGEHGWFSAPIPLQPQQTSEMDSNYHHFRSDSRFLPSLVHHNFPHHQLPPISHSAMPTYRRAELDFNINQASALPPNSDIPFTPDDFNDHSRYSPNSPSGSSSPSSPGGLGAVPRLPPILQVEKQVVTTSATQAASASRRTNAASFQCPVPSCTSTFTRRFNLRGHLRSHTEEKPYICEWPECGKGFARQHDCKRHRALHTKPVGAHECETCGKGFSRMDALNRHLRSEGGAGCKKPRSKSGARSGGSSSPDAPVRPESLDISMDDGDSLPISRPY